MVARLERFYCIRTYRDNIIIRVYMCIYGMECLLDAYSTIVYANMYCMYMYICFVGSSVEYLIKSLIPIFISTLKQGTLYMYIYSIAIKFYLCALIVLYRTCICIVYTCTLTYRRRGGTGYIWGRFAIPDESGAQGWYAKRLRKITCTCREYSKRNFFEAGLQICIYLMSLCIHIHTASTKLMALITMYIHMYMEDWLWIQVLTYCSMTHVYCRLSILLAYSLYLWLNWTVLLSWFSVCRRS